MDNMLYFVKEMGRAEKERDKCVFAYFGKIHLGKKR